MLRDDGGEEYQRLLKRFVDLPPSGEAKVVSLCSRYSDGTS